MDFSPWLNHVRQRAERQSEVFAFPKKKPASWDSFTPEMLLYTPQGNDIYDDNPYDFICIVDLLI